MISSILPLAHPLHQVKSPLDDLMSSLTCSTWDRKKDRAFQSKSSVWGPSFVRGFTTWRVYTHIYDKQANYFKLHQASSNFLKLKMEKWKVPLVMVFLCIVVYPQETWCICKALLEAPSRHIPRQSGRRLVRSHYLCHVWRKVPWCSMGRQGRLRRVSSSLPLHRNTLN